MKWTAVDHAQKLVTQAAAWRLASLLLERPQREWHREIAQLSLEASDATLTVCAHEARQATEELYHHLFGPGGTVSPREVSYCGFEDPGRLMSQLATVYQAFSYQPRREEPIDHISVEVGFVGYLFLKEAYARQQGNSEGAVISEDVRERFRNEHVARCAAGMHKRMGDSPAYFARVLLWLLDTADLAANEGGY
ncbi:MAG TPA: molecular chaperone TorD family protein [Candidatus Binatia bacterium]|nr:molecular chaperone TorD family protein [Candidatus Binatia bacterium]